MKTETEKMLDRAGVSTGLAADIAGLLNRYTPEPIETAPETAMALRLFAAYLNKRAERLDFLTNQQRADIQAGFARLAMRNRAAPLQPVATAVDNAAGPRCVRCDATESPFFAETEAGKHLCETCYNMGDCEPVNGETPRVNVSDLCAIPDKFKRAPRDRTVDKPRTKKGPQGPQGGQPANLQPAPETNPKGPAPAQAAPVDLLAQARALSGQA